jgi:hypothetical protein
MLEEFPNCPRCKVEGRKPSPMLPLSDYGDGASVLYKAWVCINDKCGFGIRVDKGQVAYMKAKPCTDR